MISLSYKPMISSLTRAGQTRVTFPGNRKSCRYLQPTDNRMISTLPTESQRYGEIYLGRWGGNLTNFSSNFEPSIACLKIADIILFCAKFCTERIRRANLPSLRGDFLPNKILHKFWRVTNRHLARINLLKDFLPITKFQHKVGTIGLS